MKMELQQGKRYTWSITIPFDGRMKNGLFTGEYDAINGNAILMTKTGERWSVPAENCILVKSHSY